MSQFIYPQPNGFYGNEMVPDKYHQKNPKDKKRMRVDSTDKGWRQPVALITDGILVDNAEISRREKHGDEGLGTFSKDNYYIYPGEAAYCHVSNEQERVLTALNGLRIIRRDENTLSYATPLDFMREHCIVALAMEESSGFGKFKGQKGGTANILTGSKFVTNDLVYGVPDTYDKQGKTTWKMVLGKNNWRADGFVLPQYGPNGVVIKGKEGYPGNLPHGKIGIRYVNEREFHEAINRPILFGTNFAELDQLITGEEGTVSSVEGFSYVILTIILNEWQKKENVSKDKIIELQRAITEDFEKVEQIIPSEVFVAVDTKKTTTGTERGVLKKMYESLKIMKTHQRDIERLCRQWYVGRVLYGDDIGGRALIKLRE